VGLFCAPAEKALASSDIRTVHSGHSGAQWWCWGSVVVLGHSGAQWGTGQKGAPPNIHLT